MCVNSYVRVVCGRVRTLDSRRVVTGSVWIWICLVVYVCAVPGAFVCMNCYTSNLCVSPVRVLFPCSLYPPSFTSPSLFRLSFPTARHCSPLLRLFPTSRPRLSLPPFLPSSLPPFLPSSLPPFLPSSLPPFLPFSPRYPSQICSTITTHRGAGSRGREKTGRRPGWIRRSK